MSKKLQQRELTRWLKAQGIIEKKWLHFTLILGTLNGLCLIGLAWVIAVLLQAFIVHHELPNQHIPYFVTLFVLFLVRGLLTWSKEKLSFQFACRIRQAIRQQLLDKVEQLGPAWIQDRPIGYWTTIIQEQIENLQDFYARYLPQMRLAMIIPILILIAIFPINWAAALILLVTAPLIPIFMALVGMGAAEANQRNFEALGRLSGYFLDRLKGLEAIRLFFQGKQEVENIRHASEDFRTRTMDVLKLAFLSSGVLEFFTSVSIAVVAVYFGFSYLDKLHFGSYGLTITLFSGFFALILAPEFFQPLRDLGTFYHAKAQALGAAETLHTFLTETDKYIALTKEENDQQAAKHADIDTENFVLCAKDWVVTTAQGKVLLGPCNFTITSGQNIALIGRSGSGKTTFLNGLLGFLPHQGSMTLNGVEVSTLNKSYWQGLLNWIGQNPHLPKETLRENILLGNPQADDKKLMQAVNLAYVDEFLPKLPDGLESQIGEDACYLSVGQAQRIAVARALLKTSKILLLDEPTASLDSHSEKLVSDSLLAMSKTHTTLHVTHKLSNLEQFDEIWVFEQGNIIEQGSYSQLMNKTSHLHTLLSLKQNKYSLDAISF